MDPNCEIEKLDKVLLFDGVCIFCNTSVDFILQNEKNDELRFTPLQSQTGQDILAAYEYPTDYMESILFLENGVLLSKSNAVLSIAKFLNPPFSWLRVFLFFPRGLRDLFYGFIAKRRYNWFGKYDACMIPNTDLKKRFLE